MYSLSRGIFRPDRRRRGCHQGKVPPPGNANLPIGLFKHVPIRRLAFPGGGGPGHASCPGGAAEIVAGTQRPGRRDASGTKKPCGSPFRTAGVPPAWSGVRGGETWINRMDRIFRRGFTTKAQRAQRRRGRRDAGGTVISPFCALRALRSSALGIFPWRKDSTQRCRERRGG